MAWRIAESLETLRKQLNEAFPKRSKVSDGGIGDAKHASRSSDHNPWVKAGAMGVVTARDFTHDPKTGIDCQWLADTLVKNKDPRIKYLIWKRQICSSKSSPWKWRPYKGVNAHTKHLHVSVDADIKLFDSTKPWKLNFPEPEADEDDTARIDNALTEDGYILPLELENASNEQETGNTAVSSDMAGIVKSTEMSIKDGDINVKTKTGDTPKERIAVVAPQAKGIFSKLWAKITAAITGNVLFQGLQEQITLIQGITISPNFWYWVTIMIGTGTLIWIISEVIKHAQERIRERDMTKLLVEANTTPENTVQVIRVDEIPLYSLKQYKIITRGAGESTIPVPESETV